MVLLGDRLNSSSYWVTLSTLVHWLVWGHTYTSITTAQYSFMWQQLTNIKKESLTVQKKF